MRRSLRLRFDGLFRLPDHVQVEPAIARHFRRNFIVNALDILNWIWGASFISVTAVLPVFASRLVDSPLIIGLIPALMDAGWYLPQLFMAPYVERQPRKKPIVAWLGAIERVPYLMLPLVALAVGAGMAPRTAVGLLLALVATMALASGLNATPWQELIAKVIPVSHRGRFFGVAHTLGQLLGVVAAGIAALLLARLPFPQNYAAVFACGGVGIAASLFFCLLTAEPAIAPAVPASPSAGHYLRRLRVILRQDRNFRAFLFSRWLAFFGTMASGFVAVYAVERFSLPDAQAAVFSSLLLGASVLGNLVWGPLGDRRGHKWVMEASTCFWLAALALALVGPSVWSFYGVFVLIGLANSGGMLSNLSLVMELGPEAERPTYIGLARTVTGPAVFIAPVLGGAVAQGWGYPALFTLSLVFAVLGVAVLWRAVREPRRIRS